MSLEPPAANLNNKHRRRGATDPLFSGSDGRQAPNTRHYGGSHPHRCGQARHASSRYTRCDRPHNNILCFRRASGAQRIDCCGGAMLTAALPVGRKVRARSTSLSERLMPADAQRCSGRAGRRSPRPCGQHTIRMAESAHQPSQLRPLSVDQPKSASGLVPGYPQRRVFPNCPHSRFPRLIHKRAAAALPLDDHRPAVHNVAGARHVRPLDRASRRCTAALPRPWVEDQEFVPCLG
jgi:hypothetical protein